MMYIEFLYVLVLTAWKYAQYWRNAYEGCMRLYATLKAFIHEFFKLVSVLYIEGMFMCVLGDSSNFHSTLAF
jgi:hypothetical protein